MRPFRAAVLIACRIGLFWVLFSTLNCYAQSDSSWIKSSTSSDWFNINNWTAGIPNGAGDIAQVPGASAASPTIGIATPVTLGQLKFSGSGPVTISGSGQITFDNPGDSPAIVRASPPEAVIVNATISPFLLIAHDEQLDVEVGSQSTMTLGSGFGPGNGDAAKSGVGQLNLNEGSPSWNGRLNVRAGTVTINSPNALGSTSQGTLLDGGTIVLNSVIAEPISLASGTLQTTTSFLDFNGALTLAAGNIGIVRGPVELRGGTSGAGDLRIVATSNAATTVDVAPLNHQGGTIISSGTGTRQFANFRVDNGYFGTTEVTDVTLEVRTPGGLGSDVSGTKVTRGLLRLHGASHESVSLTDSTLALWTAETTLNEVPLRGDVALNNSELTTYGEFRGAANYIVERPIQLVAGSNRISTGRGALTLAGGIEGGGYVLLNPSSSYPINVSGPINEQLNPEVRGGPVRFLHQDAFHGEIFIRNGGRLVVETDQEMRRIRFGALVQSGCCSPFGSIEVAEGASLVANDVDMIQGTIRGTVLTSNGLQFSSFVGGRTISHLDSALDVHVKAGELTVDDTLVGLQPTNASVIVERSREASIFVTQRSVTNADFHLNNGSGFNFGGALLTENDSSSRPALILQGDVYLGDDGAYIGGSDHFRIVGQIYGGDLNLGRRRSNPGLIIAARTTAYTGTTRIFSGEMIVAENGRLSDTSAIELYANGRLYVDNLPADGPVSDRIADNIPIRMHGGEISVWPTAWGMNSRERVGRIELKRGVSIVRGTHFFENSLQTHADLVVGEITRDEGAVLVLNSADRNTTSPFPREHSGPGTDLVLETPPPLVNGILPVWIALGNNFTTYDAQGRIRSYQGPFSSFAAADETSIVRPPSTPSSVTSDKAIHALYASGNVGPIDLEGHVLTIGSGGISGATLSNGTIRPGQHANGELIFFGGNTINANIVDNGRPTSVVYSGDVALGGNNSYSGKTYVVGRPGEDVMVNKASALPSGTDIDISGDTELFLRDLSGNVKYRFGDIAIRDGGTLSAQCCGNGDTVAAEGILLEAGSLSVPLVGAIPIVKRTDGIATMRRSSPGFTGRVDVLQGILQAGDSGSEGYLTFGQGTVNVEPEGRLVLSPVSLPAGPNPPVPTIKLNGGSLFGVGIPLDGQANLRGTLQVTENSTIYLLDGLADRPRSADIIVEGSIHVDAGKTLEVIGRPDTSRGLRVTGAIQLESGSVLAGDGAIRSRVTIANGAVLSPGLMDGPGSVGLLATSTPIFTNESSQSLMTWGANGRYRWEINDAGGDEGAPFGRGWDATRIGVLLNIEATASSPFIIEPVALSRDGEMGLVQDLDPRKHYRWLIAEIGTINAFSARIEGFESDKFVIDISTFQQVYPQARADSFWLDRDSRGIFLNAILAPEPPVTSLLFIVASAFFAARPRMRQISKSI